MKDLNHPTTHEDLSGAWCNDNEVTSSIMEAVSFVTPVMEKFFIRTVSEGLSPQTPASLKERCTAFIHEEADHTRVHRKFNASLTGYLGGTPPGLALLDTLLEGTRKYLSLSSRLLLAAALEHYTAVLSKAYLAQADKMDIRPDFARELFIRHAREEIAHRSVVFDLWRSRSGGSSFKRSLTVLAILLAGGAYLTVAVPWILHRKTGGLGRTLAAIARFAAGNRADITAYSPLPELFSFARRDYHPDHLVEDGLAGAAR
ncbi:MAG TPA: metal-dependent hydrolase [Gallionella sp.]|nr:metal-dependent hydrolase [Gallionella sp.]